MLNFVDNFLNKITMYRLTLYCLIFMYAAAVALSFFGVLPYNPFALFVSIFIIIVSCWVANAIFARVFGAPANIESVYITALILALIIAPPLISNIAPSVPFLIWASIWAMASKYILAFRKKHIFNPAAFAVALTAISINQSANWWVGSGPMTPIVLVGGLLIARKIQRGSLIFSFLAAAALSIAWFSLVKGSNLGVVAGKTIFESPILFFAFIMLTEPLTAPPGKIARMFYGALVGLLFAPAAHIGQMYFTPELALLAGNIFSFFASPKGRHVLKLKEKKQAAAGVYDFIFLADNKFAFKPGQYLEWTLGHKHPDQRGNRRYFTIASSPTESEVRLGVKFYENSSSFKKALISMDAGNDIVASQLAGDFILPKNQNQKLVFIAGGIGITPFRSMIKYLLDTRQKMQIVVFYAVKTQADIAYKDIFYKAQNELGIKTIYQVGGYLDESAIKSSVPDYQERIFYLSGPRSMVVVFEKMLKNMGIKSSQIKTDFFPGFV